MIRTRTSIRLVNLQKQFGRTAAVAGVSLDIAAGELFFLLGPSGCGKSTLLRMLAGFVQPDAGDIYFGDERITAQPPQKRDAGLVFQTYALWPHMTVAQNVGYGLQVRKLARPEIAERVRRALVLVRMEGFGDRKPTQLSGGQQQRVALARALVIEPRVLLLDEPLSNLDARLREEMREEIRRVHTETGLTMVYVTHDQKEALALADRLAVMEQGRLIQVGPPLEVYRRPVNHFVAGFLGESNFLPGTVRDVSGDNSTIETAVGQLTVTGVSMPSGAVVICSIRPHALTILPSGADGPNRMMATVESVSFLGEVLSLRCRVASDTVLQVTILPQATEPFKVGDTLSLSVMPQQVAVFQA